MSRKLTFTTIPPHLLHILLETLRSTKLHIWSFGNQKEWRLGKLATHLEHQRAVGFHHWQFINPLFTSFRFPYVYKCNNDVYFKHVWVVIRLGARVVCSIPWWCLMNIPEHIMLNDSVLGYIFCWNTILLNACLWIDRS